MARLKEEHPYFHDQVEHINCTFGAYCELGKGSRLTNVRLGDYSYCDRYADLSNAQIGKFSNIASFVRIGASDHPLNRASLHHFLYRSDDYWDNAVRDGEWFAIRAARTASIGHDTWIGHNAQVKPEVKIGHGAVVASGAIVTKDVPPYQIVAGVPAEPMRQRVSAELIDRLIEVAWWDWPHSKLKDTLNDFRNLSVEEFLEKHC